MNMIIKRLWVMSVMFLLFSCTGRVEIPDANFNAYLLENFDSNGDGFISLSEAKKVRKMDCSDRNIQSLKGIEKFVNLESLNCSNNRIDELDLRDNKKLKTLISVDYNEHIAQVKIPDANFNAFLLEHFDTNRDGFISVLEARNVTILNCSGKMIESLEGIEKFANLEYLDCSDNRLEELELRYNKKLERLICTDNKAGLIIYIGMSSPLRNKDLVPAAANATPEMANMKNPIDTKKVTYDADITGIQLYFED
jgi:hypothetical protein